MRNVIILGASALVLALGVAQASASQSNSVADYRAAAAAVSTQPAYVGELRDFGGSSVDLSASHATNFSTLDANARHGGQ
jgi:hypothetical protein